MRLFLSALLTALMVPLAAYAQAPKLVEVINDPLAVEIVNPAPPSAPVRFQLVGFTTATFGGFSFAAGTPSLFDMTAACQAEFDPLARMCRVDDIQLTTAIPLGLPTGEDPAKPIRAWVNPDPANVVVTSSDCGGWSQTSTGTGMSVDARGQLRRISCGAQIPVACCALVP